MKNSYLVFIALLSISLGSDVHTDRLLVYVENSQNDFEYIGKSGEWTNISEINIQLSQLDVVDFKPWLSNAKPTDHDKDIYLNRIYEVVFSTDRSDLRDLISQVNTIPGLSGAELKPINMVTYIPNDTYYAQQWALPIIQAPEAWDLWDVDNGDIPGTIDSSVIKVGIVDDGVHWTHPDLIANIWNNLGEDADNDGMTVTNENGSWEFDPGDINNVDDDGDGFVDNFIGWDVAATSGGAEDNDPYVVAGDGHGTNVSGCVSGVTNNGIGIAAVGWSVKIMPIKSSYTNNGYIDFGYDGLLAGAQQGANVLNCSWGSSQFSSYGQNVINTCYNTYGSIIVASAGNGNQDYGVTNLDTHYPSGYDNVISVTATGQGDHFNCWATAGTTVDLGAPGEGIRTTAGSSSYDSPWGTSFSSPITAGAVALVWSKFPSESKDWVVQKIIDNTDYYADMDRDCTVRNNGDSQNHVESMTGQLGSGRLNVFKALAGGIFPSLSITDVNLQNDSDGDGIWNPGETVNAKIIVANEVGWADATDVVAVLSTEDPQITILDNIIEFPNSIPSGSSAFTLFDSFQFSAEEGSEVGNVDFTVTLYAGADPYAYVKDEEIIVAISLNQSGFPFETGSIKSSPIVHDLDNDGYKEIFIGSDDFNLYGINPTGLELEGFPITTGNQVRSSPAIGDVQGDGDLELVFGSKDRALYIANSDGSTDAIYNSTGYIMDAPVLANIDDDPELEIIFGTFESGSTGKLYAINHDATDVSGFPIDVGEVIMVSPSVDDINNDGIKDIVFGTWSNNIFAYDANGIALSGFPFVTGNRINTSPALANVTGDENLEIIAASDDNNVYVIDASGFEVLHVQTGGAVKSSPSFYDVNFDGYAEVLFGSADNMLYFYDIVNNEHVSGWPIDVGDIIYSSPVIGDIDNDDEPDIIACYYGGVTAYALDGTLKTNMPIPLQASIESTPVVTDIDSDNDMEIVVGSSVGLQVIDLKYTGGQTAPYWNLYKGNAHRTGSNQDINLTIESLSSVVPDKYEVSAAYPNPFNPSTTIDISLPAEGDLRITVYNMVGQEVTTLVNKRYMAGTHRLTWNGVTTMGNSVGTGLYIVQVKFKNHINNQKVLLVK